MADELGCRYLQAVGPYEGTLSEAAEGFGALCDRAGAHGLLVGVEFLPFTNVARRPTPRPSSMPLIGRTEAAASTSGTTSGERTTSSRSGT